MLVLAQVSDIHVDGSVSPINEVHRVGGVLVAMCDSTIPGEAGGYLDDETLAWLDDALREAGDDIPALVCFHDPPVTLALPYVDGIRLAGEHRHAEVLDDEHRLTTRYRVVTG